MLEIDATDEALIDADPATVFRAVLDEMQGRTHWWAPHWEATPRGAVPTDHPGGVFDITVRGRPTVRFTARTAEIVRDRLIRAEYIGGAFRGEGTWTLEPADRRTRLRFRFHVQPKGGLRLLLWLRPRKTREATAHHRVMRAGLEGLNRYLQRRNEGAA